jgi:TolB-like protein
VTAWLLLQIVDVVADPLRLPEWFATVVVVLLAIGLPLALVLAWAFELTPEGVRRASPHDGAAAIPPGQSRMDYVLAGLLLIAIGWMVYSSLQLKGGIQPQEGLPATSTETSDRAEAAPQVPHNSIAVLPFVNLSPDPDDAYFAAGIHEEILNQLAKIEDLTVIARTSVMQYEGVRKPIEEIAAELNVGSVMEGSVRYAGDRVRIASQLIDARTGAHLWSEAYDRNLKDIFSIQSDIALQITKAMKAEFSLSEQAAIATPPTDSLEAYGHYLKALVTPMVIEDPTERHRELDAALALDPMFSLAMAYKAFIHGWQISGVLGVVPLTPAYQRRNADLARMYAERALAINPDESLAYLALAFVHAFELEWLQWVSHVDRAYQLNPNSPYVALVQGHVLAEKGQAAEALLVYERSFALDPQNWIGVYYATATQSRYGNLDIAQALGNRLVDAAPQTSFGYAELALIAAMSGEESTAIAMALKTEAVAGRNSDTEAILTLMEAYHWLQRPDDVSRLFALLKANLGSEALNDDHLFRAYWALDETDIALDHLESGIREHFPAGVNQIVGLAPLSRTYASLWGNPRFEAALGALRYGDVFSRPSPPPVFKMDR